MTHICSENDIFSSTANSFWTAAQSQTPATLYHYCTADGGMSVLRSQKMWSSAFECMNDEGEFRVGLDMAMDEVELSIDRLPITMKEQIRDSWRKFLDREKKSPSLRPYVLSFSDDAKNIHMWKSYADEYKGLCLQFNFLKEQIARTRCHIIKMSYDVTTKRNELETNMKVLENLFAPPNTCEKCLRPNLEKLFFAYLQTVFLSSISVKENKWSLEKEWRLVSFASPGFSPQSDFGDIRFRTRSGCVIDFLEIDLCAVGLLPTTVVCGSQSTNLNSLQILASQNKCDLVVGK